jgi:hypothetical protein
MGVTLLVKRNKIGVERNKYNTTNSHFIGQHGRNKPILTKSGIRIRKEDSKKVAMHIQYFFVYMTYEPNYNLFNIIGFFK